jgi:hypothetical protein
VQSCGHEDMTRSRGRHNRGAVRNRDLHGGGAVLSRRARRGRDLAIPTPPWQDCSAGLTRARARSYGAGVAFSQLAARWSHDRRSGSDRRGELVERDCQPLVHWLGRGNPDAARSSCCGGVILVDRPSTSRRCICPGLGAHRVLVPPVGNRQRQATVLTLAVAPRLGCGCQRAESLRNMIACACAGEFVLLAGSLQHLVEL